MSNRIVFAKSDNLSSTRIIFVFLKKMIALCSERWVSIQSSQHVNVSLAKPVEKFTFGFAIYFRWYLRYDYDAPFCTSPFWALSYGAKNVQIGSVVSEISSAKVCDGIIIIIRKKERRKDKYKKQYALHASCLIIIRKKTKTNGRNTSDRLKNVLTKMSKCISMHLAKIMHRHVLVDNDMCVIFLYLQGSQNKQAMLLKYIST